MELYFHPISLFSHKVMMAFFEKGLSFEPKPVNLTDPAARAEFRQVHPLGKVPLLVCPEGKFSESTSIVEWLDQHYQVPRLIPEKPEEARQVRLIDRQVDLYLNTNCSLLFFQSLKPEAERDKERIAIAEHQIPVILAELEGRLAARPDNTEFLVGQNFSLADINLLSALCVLSAFGFDERYPLLQAYFERHKNRPSLLAAKEGAERGRQQIADAIAGRQAK